jgi:hypothetical protein
MLSSYIGREQYGQAPFWPNAIKEKTDLFTDTIAR